MGILSGGGSLDVTMDTTSGFLLGVVEGEAVGIV